jgi:hypothetical protein
VTFVGKSIRQYQYVHAFGSHRASLMVGNNMAELYLTRKEFLALPVEERRKILEKQANNEGILKWGLYT